MKFFLKSGETPYCRNENMKLIIITLGIIIGCAFGIFPGIAKPKPMLWKIIAVLILGLSFFLNLYPPVAGSLEDLIYNSGYNSNYSANAIFKISLNNANLPGGDIQIFDIEKPTKQYNLKLGNSISSIYFIKGYAIVAKLKYDSSNNSFKCMKIVRINPLLTLPLVPGLEERIKIMNFHVPAAWIAVLAYLISMLFSIQYLRNRKQENDLFASSSAALGTIFCILATITGMIWAKFSWGMFWNWDPREISIFILLLIYSAYFSLRAAIDRQELKARLSSAYAIIAFFAGVFLVFILPRITSGLHPGSGDDTNAGPILSSASDSLNWAKQITFSLSLCAYTIIYFWLFNLTVRIKKIELINNIK